jgi:hypothetical protein
MAAPFVKTASWYHCSLKIVGRSEGRSAVAASAYRTGLRLVDNETQKVHDYTRRKGVEASFIVAPENAPEWVYDEQSLWNEAHAADKKSNARLAREWEIALPACLELEAREQIAREIAENLVERYGVAVSVALHEPSEHGDSKNFHVHIMTTTREVSEDGLGAKTRIIDAKQTGAGEVTHIRKMVANVINQALEDAGSDERVDHRSYKERGIEKEPTHHLGVEASAMERRNEPSRIGEENREIKDKNALIDELKGDLSDIDKELLAFMLQEPEAESRTEKPDSPCDNPLLDEFVKDIMEHGEIREFDIDGKQLSHEFSTPFLTPIRNFVYDMADRVSEVAKKAKNQVKDTIEAVSDKTQDLWQRYITKRREEPEAEKDNHEFER